MSSPRFWVIRVPKGEEYIKAARKKGLVAVGFRIPQSIASVSNREEVKALYREAYPEATEPRVVVGASQLYRVAHVIRDKDWILTPDRSTRRILYGQAKGEYEYMRDAIGSGYSHARRVEWMGEFSRDLMSTSLKNSMGGIATVLNMDKHSAELLQLMGQTSRGGGEEDGGEEASLYDETKSKAAEQISDILAAIDPYQFQDLVAGLLEAMGYRTRVSQKGPDQGVDIIAHPDVLGFEMPRIKVQVKHRQTSAGGADIRNLVGTLTEGERGLFVSTSGFSSEAMNEARRHGRLALVDGDEFVELLTEHYDSLDSDYKSLVPLRKVWVPVLVK